MSNPASSLEFIKVWPSGIFQAGSDIDKELMILPIEQMRELLEYETEVSAVELRLKEGTSASELQQIQEKIAKKLGRPQEELDKWEARSNNWKNVFDPSHNLMRGRKWKLFCLQK